MKSEISNPQGVTRSARAKMGIYDNQGSGGQLTGTGRFARVSGPGLENGAVYQRPINSELISNVAFGASPPYAAVVNTYEPNRDLRISVTNLVFTPMSTVSQYFYDHDVIGRRKSVVYTGTAFAENHLFKWGYSDRSELETADRHQGTNPNSPGNQYTQYGDYEFNYDHIGNRTTYGLDANPDTAYAANDVNQYTGTTSPTEAFSHDLDGNLTLDRQFLYTWDAENRLIRVETRINWGQHSSAYDVGDKRVYFSYDYMGRRVRKRVETYDGSSWPETSDELFVYDGWNPVLVIDGNATDVNAATAVTRKYTWGLDLSGSIHGAGGIGGLLACEEPQATGGPKRYWFFYDANGNVGQVMDATNTGNISIAAKYEYDPYGNPIWPDPDNDGDWQEHLDPYTLANPFRFSTKWFDDETGLGNWTFRYYSPRLGRWISRDPIGEEGGLNLYNYLANAPTTGVDPYGLFFGCSSEPETPQDDCSNCWDTCMAYQDKIPAGTPGVTICREDGCRCACVNEKYFENNKLQQKYPSEAAKAILRWCVILHEACHSRDSGRSNCNCTPKPCPLEWNDTGASRRDGECAGYKRMYDCLVEGRKKCPPADDNCRRQIDAAMKFARDMCAKFGGNIDTASTAVCPQ